jgi:hypothetical protein
LDFNIKMSVIYNDNDFEISHNRFG